MSKRITMCLLGIGVLVLAGCAKGLPSGPDAVWDLVVIGDAYMTGLGDAYAAQIEQDMDVKVIVHDYTIDGLSAGNVQSLLSFDKITNDALATLPDALKDAEVVLMAMSGEHYHECVSENADLGKCWIYVPFRETCGPDRTFSGTTMEYESIWSNIMELRDGRATILRTTDIYNPRVADWQDNDQFAPYFACWDILSGAIERAADTHGIPFVSRYDVFNGANHDEDAMANGYVSPGRGIPSDMGNQRTAELLGELGYEPTGAP